MNPLLALISAIDWLLKIYTFIIIADAILSWVSPDPRNPIVALLRALTEPVCAPFRRLVPASLGIDFSPLIVIFIIYLIRQLLHQLAFRLVLG